MSTTSFVMAQTEAQTEPHCVTSNSLTLSWGLEDAIEGDPDVNLNGFICVLSYTEFEIPRLVVDDLE